MNPTYDFAGEVALSTGASTKPGAVQLARYLGPDDERVERVPALSPG